MPLHANYANTPAQTNENQRKPTKTSENQRKPAKSKRAGQQGSEDAAATKAETYAANPRVFLTSPAGANRSRALTPPSHPTAPGGTFAAPRSLSVFRYHSVQSARPP